MSWQASTWALEQRVGDPILKILLLAAANYADPDGRCWPKVATLAFDSEVSTRTIQRKLVELQTLGFIEITERFDAGGKQISSMIQLRMGGGCQKVTPGICQGEGDTTLSPPDSLNNQLNKQSTSARKKKADDPYSEEFEEKVWKPYPRKLNASKKKAWDLYRMLNAERQQQVRDAIPIFAESMRREGRPEDKIKHLQFWISERIYETVRLPAASSTGTVAARTYRDATRGDWEKILKLWLMVNDWRESWGPEPGKPGCAVPPDMVAAHNVKHRGHLFSDEQLEAFRSQVRDAETKGLRDRDAA